MKTKINKISIAVVMAVLAFAVIASLAWTTISSKAFASDKESINADVAVPQAQEASTPEAQPAAEPTNEITQFSVKVDGLAEGVLPEISLYDNIKEELIDYNFGDYLDIENGTQMTAEVDQGIVYISVIDTDHNYFFTVCDPIGYDNHNVPSSVTITGVTDFTIQYQEYTGLYGINVTVYNESNQPIPGCNVKYVDNEWNVIKSGTTGSDGTLNFENLTKEQACGIVVLNEEGYLTDDREVSGADYEKITHIAGANIVPRSESNARIKLNSNDENHLNFEAKWEVSMVDDPTIFNGSYYKLPSLAIRAELLAVAGQWTVTPEGSMINSQIVYSTIRSNYEINPIAKEGYIIDYWTIDKGDGNKFDVKPNETFTLEEGEKLIAEAFYTISPKPGPEPEPEPTPTPIEEVVAGSSQNAQTGDGTVALPLAILAAACAVALVARRRCN